jgi:hypothetical protein
VAGRDSQPASIRNIVGVKSGLIAVAALPALLLATGAQARRMTTVPTTVVDIHVTITDTRITLDRHSAPRGDEARFVIRNTGTRSHNFTVQDAFTRTLKPNQRQSVRLFLDFRTKLRYFDNLPGQRTKPGMHGFIVIG